MCTNALQPVHSKAIGSRCPLRKCRSRSFRRAGSPNRTRPRNECVVLHAVRRADHSLHGRGSPGGAGGCRQRMCSQVRQRMGEGVAEVLSEIPPSARERARRRLARRRDETVSAAIRRVEADTASRRRSRSKPGGISGQNLGSV
jgi:hypothetical protein